MEYSLFQTIEEVSIKDEDKVKKDIYELWQESFGDSDEYTDFYFEWKIGKNQVLTIYKEFLENGIETSPLAAMLHLNPYSLMVKNKEIPANYIVGVATKESERRKGLMNKLLQASMEQMYKEEMPFTYLMPAKESIYLPFDFRIVYEQEAWNDKLSQARIKVIKEERIDVKAASMDDSEILRAASIDDENDYKIVVLETYDIERINELVSFTNELLANEHDIYAKRNPYYYERLINEMRSASGEVILCYDKDELIGFASYMAEEAIYITEFMTYGDSGGIANDIVHGIEEDVLKAFWKYFSSVTDLDIFKKKQGSQITAIMVRIINLESFVKMFNSNSPVSLVFDIKDPIIASNQGRFLLGVDKDKGNIERSNSNPDISIDIADLARLFFGKLEENELDRLILKDRHLVKKQLAQINIIDSLFINDVI